MTMLGAIFAGGMARRFGSDKAAALLHGRALLDHVHDRLRGQCDAVVVVGRRWPGLPFIPDLPAPGLGPLGALAGALSHAAAEDFSEVLSSGCDLPDLPRDLALQLGDGPAVIIGQPLLGRWPSGMSPRLLRHLAECDDRSMRGWIAASGARQVSASRMVANVNRTSDLEALQQRFDFDER